MLQPKAAAFRNACCACTAAIASVLLLISTPSVAQTTGDFYRGKTIDFFVGAAAGGGFDVTARMMAPYLKKHLPGNPAVVIRAMPGAAGLVMTNHITNAAAADGTVIGMSTSSVPYEPRLRIASPDGSNIKFDPLKLQWIGTPVREPQVSWVWHASGVTTWADLKTKKILFGATSPGGDNAIFPELANQLLGLTSKVVTGYKGIGDIYLAIESGELNANNTAYSNLTVSKASWLREGKAKVIMQFGLRRLPALKDVPSLIELVNDPDDLAMLRFFLLKFEMHRPIFARPGVPADRIAALRMAFDKSVADPDFLAEAERLGIEINPLDGNGVAKLVEEVMATPQPVVDRLRTALAAMGAK